jgi:N-acetylglucosaminyl-diphospho-decaprenol L-rhamnosyltransferase
MISLSVIILNHNTADLVIQCLKSIYETVDPQIHSEVIVVDNASADDSVSRISSAYQCATVIQAPSNLGFAKGNNLGIRHATGEFLLLLNSDTIVCANMIARLVGVLQNNPTVGAVGSRILNLDGTDQDYPTRFPSLPQMIARLFVRRQTPWLSEPAKMPIRTKRIMGACLMTRRDVLDQVGFLDENFFMYDEDVDWSIRCRKAGWDLWLMPDVATIHLKGQTSLFRQLDTNSFNGRMFRELRRSRYRLYRKHAGMMRTLILKMFTDIYLISALAIGNIRVISKPSMRFELREKLRAYVDVLCMNPFARQGK